MGMFLLVAFCVLISGCVIAFIVAVIRLVYRWAGTFADKKGGY
jgi:hypothetical protein